MTNKASKTAGRPGTKPLPVYLTAEQRRQLREIQIHENRSASATVVQVIRRVHEQLKKEFPNEFA